MQLAAQMIDLRVRESNGYALEFNFSSPSDRSTFYVQSINGQFASQVMPPVTTSATGGPLPLEFLDLPAAIAKAEQQGMPHIIKEASLQISGSKIMTLAWAIQPETDDAPYLYTINATTGAVSSAGDATTRSGQRAPQTGSSSDLAPTVTEPVMASGLLAEVPRDHARSRQNDEGPGDAAILQRASRSRPLRPGGRTFPGWRPCRRGADCQKGCRRRKRRGAAPARADV